MKKILVALLIINLIQACTVAKGWEHYAVQEPGGKAYLKEMQFKKSFKPEMANYIDEDAIYAWKRPESAGLPNYVIFRFFKTGQWISFSCNELESSCVNNLDQKSFAGYYNYKNGEILTETANFNFSQGGVRQINRLKIFEDGSLSINYLEMEIVYQKIKNSEVKMVVPNW